MPKKMSLDDLEGIDLDALTSTSSDVPPAPKKNPEPISGKRRKRRFGENKGQRRQLDLLEKEGY